MKKNAEDYLTEAEKIKLENLRKRFAATQKKISELEAKSKTKERARRNRERILWGIVVDQMLQGGELNANEWASKCRRHLVNEKDRAAALEGIAALFPAQPEASTE